jgi:hypothetical protein
MDPPNLRTQPAANGPQCASCTWMKVLDAKYTCGKYGNRNVRGNNLCNDYGSTYEGKGREILEKYRAKKRLGGYQS